MSGQHGLGAWGFRLLDRRMRCCGRRARGHRRDQQAPPGRTDRLLAVLPDAPGHRGDLRGQHDRGGYQPFGGQIVGVVQVVEFWSR
ncbi:Uncharacterised protein [Mycobacterium tuberculosis]|nr:Uncharacterised protein [Mycobacterium tuberculosis]